MDSAQKAAVIMARVARANAEVAGMTAENTQRSLRGESMAFVYDDYERVAFTHQILDCNVLAFMDK